MPTSPGTERPRGLLPKKCRYCERRFSKAEHLKRHQRSHTGERPYTCPRCNKSFSRSDVLIRHLKNHPQIVGEEVEKSPSEGDFIQVDSQQQQALPPLPPIPQQQLQNIDPNLPPHLPPHLPPIHEQIQQDVHQRQEYIPSPSVIDPALEGPLEHAERRPSQSVPSGLDHLAQLASQQKWGNRTMDTVMGDSANAAIPEMSGPPTWNMEISNGGHNAQYEARSVQADPSFQNLGPSPNTASKFGFEQEIYAGRMNGMHDHLTPDMGGIAPDVAIMPQDLQTWFDQFDLESTLQPGHMPEYGQSQHNGATPILRRGSSLASEGQNSLRNPSSPSTLIPNERFSKVEKCWPTRHSNPLRLMPTLWWDAVTKTEDNLFSNSNLSPEAMEQNRQCGSRWGLDEDCRERLQKMFVTINHPTRDSGPAAFGSPENYSTPSDTRSVLQAPSVIGESPITTNFPPAEIFDIGLDLYFRQFHPLMPFIHTPTFCPKTAPTSILFIMCLIGLTILQTKGATAFVRQTFSKALEQVSAEFITASGIEGNRIDQMSSLASAVLILNLTEMTGQKSHQAQCQMLYTNVIMTAQKNGLFNANDGQPLTDTFFGQITDLDARWKAWGRIECAKRLIMSLTLVDTWYSAMLHTSPILRTEELQLILPCDAALFQAPTAQRWAHLASTNHQLTMPYVSLSKDILTLPELPSSLEPLAMHGILSIIRLRISQDFHRLLSGTSFRAVEHSFVPCLTYETDPLARKTQSLVVQTMTSYQSALTHMNPNCLVLWHNMCIMLTSDARLFETGAGCAGPVAARQALDDIARWTQTSSARRACLHAAQTFKVMSNRRASDGDPFHASSGLFLSALILGLYVFMVPPESDTNCNGTNPSFDLADEVNWTVVGDEGLVSPNLVGGKLVGKQEVSNDAATNFIRNGGGICFDGVVHRPGYEAARRILLDYARLLEDLGRWRVRINQFSRVLRIMSDALVDVDVGMGGQ